MKSAGKPKSEWQPHVATLLQLKADLASAQKAAPQTSPANVAVSSDSSQSAQVVDLEDAIKKQVYFSVYPYLLEKKTAISISFFHFQGDLVRELKSSGKSKEEWQPEVNKLLQLKQQLAALQPSPSAGVSAESKSTQSSGSGKSKSKKKK